MNRSEVLENIRNQVGRKNLFYGNSFKRGNCSADLSGVSENDRVVVDLDKVYPHGQQDENQCECILFYFNAAANFVVVPIELKGSKNAEAAKAVEQLKGGAAFAATFTPTETKTLCFPVLFHNHLSRSEIKRLRNRQSRVHFNGKSFDIKTERCGGKLSNVIPISANF